MDPGRPSFMLRIHSGAPGLKASTWLCPEMAKGGTLEFGRAPVRKSHRMNDLSAPR